MSEVKGVIYSIGQTQVVSDKFSKREIVVQTEGEHLQSILIQFTQDKCSVLDAYQVGNRVNVAINLRGKLWTGKDGVEKCFNTIEGWKIELLEGGQSNQNTEAPQETNDLPF